MNAFETSKKKKEDYVFVLIVRYSLTKVHSYYYENSIKIRCQINITVNIMYFCRRKWEYSKWLRQRWKKNVLIILFLVYTYSWNRTLAHCARLFPTPKNVDPCRRWSHRSIVPSIIIAAILRFSEKIIANIRRSLFCWRLFNVMD